MSLYIKPLENKKATLDKCQNIIIKLIKKFSDEKLGDEKKKFLLYQPHSQV